MKATGHALVVSAFFVLALIIIFQGIYIKNTPRPSETSIIGTFSAGNGPAADAHYIVFERDGVCAHYVQFGDVEYGTYALEDHAVSMTFSDNAACAVYDGDTLYVFAADANQAVPFGKLSHTPTYINVTDRAVPY
jgi:hypothetical protein